MEKSFSPKDLTSFVTWLLQLSLNNDWTIVVEHSDDDTYNYLVNHTTIASLPITTRHEYASECKLTAFSNVIVTDNFVNKLILKSHVLSIHDKNQMIFLIADDFHDECISCTENFYTTYYKELEDKNLIYTKNTFELSFKTADPNAQALMIEDFYWSETEETGPFGSLDGWSAADEFKHWRFKNKSKSPIIFLEELIAAWYYPYFDWNEMDTTKIKEFIFSRADMDEADIQHKMQQLRKEFKNSPVTSMQNIDDEQLRQIVLASEKKGEFLLGQDNAIVGTAFAQFCLEGKIDRDLKALTITALKRQLLPVLINSYDENYREKRKKQLTKMLEVINEANSK